MAALPGSLTIDPSQDAAVELLANSSGIRER
jgi:hypothetical protein